MSMDYLAVRALAPVDPKALLATARLGVMEAPLVKVMREVAEGA